MKGKVLNDFLEGKVSLKEIWDGCDAEVSTETLAQLSAALSRLGLRHSSLRRPVLSFISAAAALVAVALISVYLARKSIHPVATEFTQCCVHYGDTAIVRLSDGTQVAMNGGSTMVYPVSFDGGTRTVFFSGEGNFSVASDPEHPFIVKTDNMEVLALGTRFCIESYNGERICRTTLMEGKVSVSVPSLDNKSFILEPGMQLSLNIPARDISVSNVDAEKVAQWENGYLYFVSASFDEVVSRMERRYDIEFIYDSSKGYNRSLNLRFMPDESLDEALEVLTMVIPGSRCKTSGRKVYFYFK